MPAAPNTGKRVVPAPIPATWLHWGALHGLHVDPAIEATIEVVQVPEPDRVRRHLSWKIIYTRRGAENVVHSAMPPWPFPGEGPPSLDDRVLHLAARLERRGATDDADALRAAMAYIREAMAGKPEDSLYEAVRTLTENAATMLSIVRAHAHHHFTCPVCQRTSWNPRDAEEGYCAACHDWTGKPAPTNEPPTKGTP